MYDVVIVGCGFVGMAFAALLNQKGIKYCVLEKNEKPNKVYQIQDARGLALNAPSIQLLKKLNIFSALDNEYSRIKKIQVSEKNQFGCLTLEADAVCVCAQGLREQLGSILNKNLIFYKSIINEINHYKDYVEIVFIDSNNKTQKIKTKLLVGADGIDSYIRKNLKIPTKIFNYNQNAFVTNVFLEQPHQNVAIERFTEQGVLAMLPFGNKIMKTIWVTKDKEIDNFLERTQASIKNRVGNLLSAGIPYRYPLISVRAVNFTAHRTVLIGNAANTLHPIAAQGLNLGFKDVLVLDDLLFQTNFLFEYQKIRQYEHDKVFYLTHSLTKGHKIGPLLSLINVVFPMKNLIRKQGMGEVFNYA